MAGGYVTAAAYTQKGEEMGKVQKEELVVTES